MAKKSEAKRIREVLTEAPTLENSEVIELLKAEGVSVTSSQVSAQRKNVEVKQDEPSAEVEPVVATEPTVVLGYDALRLRKQLGCSMEAMEKVVAVQQAEGLDSPLDAVRHLLEQQ